MPLDPDALRRHYASLSNDALAEIDPTELVPDARAVLQDERSRRGNTEPEVEPVTSDDDGPRAATAAATYLYDDPPPWFDTAAQACGFGNHPGQANSPEAQEACKYLNAAGIPTYLTTDEFELLIYVPGVLGIKAKSVLDVHIFNPQQEETWRTHLKSMKDDELPTVSPEIVCAGLHDLIRRLTRAYEDELARRGLNG